MTDIVKFVIIGVVGALFALSIKKYQPESAMLLSLLTGILILGAALLGILTIREFLSQLSNAAGLGGEIFYTLFKVVGIAVVMRIGVDTCRDAGENAVASRIELAGNTAMILTILPLVTGLLNITASFL